MRKQRNTAGARAQTLESRRSTRRAAGSRGRPLRRRREPQKVAASVGAGGLRRRERREWWAPAEGAAQGRRWEAAHKRTTKEEKRCIAAQQLGFSFSRNAISLVADATLPCGEVFTVASAESCPDA
ncbi:hypothetical protein GUJ93_ZPchr0012g20204 [Zizania palustris]|uniref:Uncharacterized protein n=1 Tax=Zizania palustris TaxID=103762 RepID=A0A8J5WU94_ZIZPA|nr:hypothetical protein GUJ93_ZPchr0012g20204 [Zizania palustris]